MTGRLSAAFSTTPLDEAETHLAAGAPALAAAAAQVSIARSLDTIAGRLDELADAGQLDALVEGLTETNRHLDDIADVAEGISRDLFPAIPHRRRLWPWGGAR